MKRLIVILWVLGAFLLGGCAQPLPPSTDPTSDLSQAIAALAPEVDPEEAQRAASIAFSYSSQLASDYGVTTAPLVHNSKVNAGLKDRGLCYHYAEDMQRRLNQEGFQTLTLLRAIAEPRNPLSIDHSTAVIAPAGSNIYDGIVLDPWRHGGRLFWSKTTLDARYNWEPRMRVLHRKQARKLKQALE